MRIAIVGSKGIPAKYGGYETFAEKISLEWLRFNHEVLVIGDLTNNYTDSGYLGIDIINIKISKSSNPILFYHFSLKKAKNWGAEKVVMCGVGGTFSVPLFKNYMDIFVNPDGLGFKRDKWSIFKKIALIFQFKFSAKFNDYLICDSRGIANYYIDSLGRSKNTYVAEYGTEKLISEKTTVIDKKYLASYDLKEKKYDLIVSRLEPENNVHVILEGYKKHHAKQKHPIIVVGNLNTKFSKTLISDFQKVEGIKFVNGIYNQDALMAIRKHCRFYFHGHSVGGTNPSLLEAMGAGNFIVAHDNEFNREVLDNKGLYFKNANDISKILNLEIPESQLKKTKNTFLDKATRYYTWPNIAQKYLDIFHETEET